ncbi:MAG: hypothetical protein H0Z24_07950 [Thermosipho sp. (in: Bacteria)]|nr:hypothetical protein [Thermosipho sp. (in: thermotogales)]
MNWNWEEIVKEIDKNCPDCVQCGYCCKHTPCYYGKWDDKKMQCTYLTEDNLCGIYEKIVELEKDKPPSEQMFGSGCCLNYMNPDRLKKLKMKESNK